MRYDGLIASKIRMLFQEEQKMSLVELFYKDEPDQIPELHDYKITLVYQDGTTSGMLSVTAYASVDAIRLTLSAAGWEHGDVAMVTCKEVA